MSAAAACAGAPHPTAAPAPGPTCPASVTALLPAARTTSLFARPRAIYDHPRLGPLVARTFDDAAERALIRRAERTGYDVRTLDRVAAAWTQRGAVYFAAGPLDAARMGSLLWERLLSPRRRARDRGSNERMEGTLGASFVSMLAVPSCGLAAYAEGDTAAVDRAVAAAPGRDPDDLLVWHTSHIPEPVTAAAGDALMHHVRDLEVRVRGEDVGLAVTVRVDGPLPADAPATVRRALDALVTSPLGEISGAIQWLSPPRATLESAPGRLTLSVHVPWRALGALADGLHGEVGTGRVD